MALVYRRLEKKASVYATTENGLCELLKDMVLSCHLEVIINHNHPYKEVVAKGRKGNQSNSNSPKSIHGVNANVLQRRMLVEFTRKTSRVPVMMRSEVGYTGQVLEN